MIKKETLPYYVLAFALFIGLKIAYRNADNSTLIWLLKPINYLFSLFTASAWVYDEEVGFFHASYNIVIDKSCSGGNFFILSFMMILISWISIFKKHKSKIIFILISLCISYVFTIFVNTSRIIVLFKLQEFQLDSFQWIHEATGSFIYLVFLILLYLTGFYYQNQKITTYEKSF